MNLAELIIMAMFDIIGYIILSKKVIGRDDLNIAKVTIFVVLFSIVMGAMSWYSLSDMRVMGVSIVLIFATIYFIFEEGLLKSIYLYLITTAINLLIQFIVISVLEILSSNIEYNFSNGLFAQAMFLLVIILISKYLPLNLIFDFLVINNRVFKYLLLNIFFILIVLWFYWLSDMDQILRNIISVFILSTGLLYINLVFLRNGLINKHEEQQRKIYEQYLPVIDELMDKLRAKQHEFDNHIQAINMLTLTSTDYESIVNSMNSYIQDLETDNYIKDLSKLENKILAGFIYSKIKKSNELGVPFKIEIENYLFNVEMKDYELIEILGNLIDNALETGVEDNKVILKLKKEKDMNVIQLNNKHPYLKKDIVNKMFKEGVSTKSNSRGYGLYNVKQLVQKYNGETQVYNCEIDGDNYVVFNLILL